MVGGGQGRTRERTNDVSGHKGESGTHPGRRHTGSLLHGMPCCLCLYLTFEASRDCIFHLALLQLSSCHAVSLAWSFEQNSAGRSCSQGPMGGCVSAGGQVWPESTRSGQWTGSSSLRLPRAVKQRLLPVAMANNNPQVDAPSFRASALLG